VRRASIGSSPSMSTRASSRRPRRRAPRQP
jgi:hypothetical protein